jgi:hypothetical protein
LSKDEQLPAKKGKKQGRCDQRRNHQEPLAQRIIKGLDDRLSAKTDRENRICARQPPKREQAGCTEQIRELVHSRRTLKSTPDDRAIP